MEHCVLRMLRCILNDSSACFTRSTFSQLGIRTFHHATAVRCSSRVFIAHRQGSLNDILCLDENAMSTSQRNTRSDGAHKLRTIVPKRRADDHCFQSAAPSIWNALPNNITSAASKHILMSKIDDFYCSKF